MSSLQLFANFENTFNSSIFYRLTSLSAYNVTLRLQENDKTVENSYYAQYTVNADPNRVSFDEKLTANISLTASVPGVNIINVTAYNDQDFTLYPQVFRLSAIFVTQFLSADFISYPQGFLYKTSPKYFYFGPPSSMYATEAAYLTALQLSGIGNAFYGEGLTETIGISANTLGSGVSAFWKIGPFSKTSLTQTDTIAISSQTNLKVVHPVSLQLCNNVFVKDGPVITYPDSLSGIPSYYPFYVSSIDPLSGREMYTTTFKRNLSVLTYPIFPDSDYAFSSPLTGIINLPLDSSGQTFAASLSNNGYDNSLFTQTYSGSNWNINAIANPGGINPDWSFTTTLLSSNIKNFKFQLSYYDQDFIDGAFLRASVGYLTTAVLNASANKTIIMQPAPGSTRNGGNTWQQKTQQTLFSSSAVIRPLPTTLLYIPNYYNLTGVDVGFTNVWNNSSVVATPLNTTIFYKTSSVNLSGGQKGSFKFNLTDIGIVDLSANTSFYTSTSSYTKGYHFPQILEVYTNYDDVEPNHYHTDLSPFNVSLNSAPRLTPNEWVTADNVNSLVDRFIQGINELDEYSSLYKKMNVITGRLEQTNVLSGTSAQTNLANVEYKWNVESIEPVIFNNWALPSLSSTIYYTGFISLPISQKFVLSYQDYLVLIDNAYKSSKLGSEVSIDQIFKFQNIQAIGSTSKDYIVVLDSTIPKVSIYTIVNNTFNLFTTWGRFGAATSKQGFNKPQDLHIDQNDLIWIADSGNNCIKQLTLAGKNLLTITSEYLVDNNLLSVCVDSIGNIHALTEGKVFVFDSQGTFSFSYNLPISGASKITTSYNRETIYISYTNGIIKYFKDGEICQYILQDQLVYDSQLKAKNQILQGYYSIYQDQFRNLYITVKDQVIRIADIMKLVRYKAQEEGNIRWSPEELYVNKEEYIQPWVYLKTFHRLWDNIEIFRNSILSRTR